MTKRVTMINKVRLRIRCWDVKMLYVVAFRSLQRRRVFHNFPFRHTSWWGPTRVSSLVCFQFYLNLPYLVVLLFYLFSLSFLKALITVENLEWRGFWVVCVIYSHPNWGSVCRSGRVHMGGYPPMPWFSESKRKKMFFSRTFYFIFFTTTLLQWLPWSKVPQRGHRVVRQSTGRTCKCAWGIWGRDGLGCSLSVMQPVSGTCCTHTGNVQVRFYGSMGEFDLAHVAGNRPIC